MKKSLIIITVLSLIITFVFVELFSIYHFGDIPTLLTISYLISLFSIFEYIFVSVFHIIKKIVNKNKISIKEIIARILLFVSLILVLLYIIILDIDWLNWYAYSSPFYLNVIVRNLEFIFPSILLIIVSIVLLKRNKI